MMVWATRWATAQVKESASQSQPGMATVRAYKRFGYEPPTDGEAGGDDGAGGGQPSLFE